MQVTQSTFARVQVNSLILVMDGSFLTERV
jgi:hypothetical protein